MPTDRHCIRPEASKIPDATWKIATSSSTISTHCSASRYENASRPTPFSNELNNFRSLFFQDSDRTSYYGIFDGHGGTDAAAYSVSHLHCEIAVSEHYPSSPAEALREAFLKTDDKFIEKSKKMVPDIEPHRISFISCRNFAFYPTGTCGWYNSFVCFIPSG